MILSGGHIKIRGIWNVSAQPLLNGIWKGFLRVHGGLNRRDKADALSLHTAAGLNSSRRKTSPFAQFLRWTKLNIFLQKLNSWMRVKFAGL